MPGVGTAVGGLLGSFLDSSSGGGGASGLAPQSSNAAVYGSGLDGSGWAVNFQGLQTATSSPTSNTGQALPFSSGAAGLSLAAIPMWVWLAGAGLILWKKFKSAK